MKHIALSLAILLATQIAFAQEVAIEQNINQPITQVIINPGWDVKLIHHQEADSGYRIAIITNEELASIAYNVRLCNIKGDTLTILENTQLPKGTLVEVEGPMSFWQIAMMPEAAAAMDQVAKAIDGELGSTERRKIWSHSVSFCGSIGYRNGPNPTNFETPFMHSGTITLSAGAQTSFKFNQHLGLNVGTSVMTNSQFLDHQVRLTDDGGLECIDGQTPIQKNMLSSFYLGIPVELHYYFGKSCNNSFSVDAFFGYRIAGFFYTRDESSNWQAWVGTETPWLFYPWKLEVGIGFNTNWLGIIHGVRVFTNILPEYNPAMMTDKMKTVGFEIKL